MTLRSSTYVLKLLDQPDGDFAQIVSRFGIDTSRLTAELTRSLDKLKKGNARTPALSPSLVKMLTEAWTIGSHRFQFAGRFAPASRFWRW